MRQRIIHYYANPTTILVAILDSESPSATAFTDDQFGIEFVLKFQIMFTAVLVNQSFCSKLLHLHNWLSHGSQSHILSQLGVIKANNCYK